MAIKHSGIAYATIGLVHLTVLAAGSELLVALTQPLLMPVLALSLWPQRGHVMARFALAALGFSWLGDTLPQVGPQRWSFLLMIVPFFCAQICYAIAFAPLRHRASARSNRLIALCYALVGIGLIALCLPGIGSQWPLPLMYLSTLLAMAMLASGLGALGRLGGLCFLVSDALIGLVTFVPGLQSTWLRVAVMVLYLVAQGALILGVRDHVAQKIPQPA